MVLAVILNLAKLQREHDVAFSLYWTGKLVFSTESQNAKLQIKRRKIENCTEKGY